MDKLRKISRLDASFKPTAFFILLILSAIAIPGMRYWLGNTAFLVEEVEVYPTSYSPLIRPIFDTGTFSPGGEGIIGKPLYSLDLEAIQSHIQTFPDVGEVKIRKTPPGTLRIDITPAVPVAILEISKRKYLVDAHGKIIRPAIKMDEYPTIKMDAQDDWGLDKISDKLEAIMGWIPAFAGKTEGKIPAFAGKTEGKIPARRPVLAKAGTGKTVEIKKGFLTINIDGIKIDLGGPPYDKKWNQLSKVLPYIKDHNKRVSYIFVGDDPNHLVIRP